MHNFKLKTPKKIDYSQLPAVKEMSTGKTHIWGAVLLTNGVLASTGWDNKILFWDLNYGQLLKTIFTDNTRGGLGTKLCALPNGQIANSATPPYKILKIWDYQSGQCVKTLNNEWTNGLIVLSDDQLATGISNAIQIWNFKDGRHLQTLSGHRDYSAPNTDTTFINSLVRLQDGRLVSTSG